MKELTRKNTVWHWGPEQANALQALKDNLTSNTVMWYFDPGKKRQTLWWVPAQFAILYQKNKEGEMCTIAYTNRALSDVERSYSQTEQ